jgi:2'-5' RNA ligase
LYVLFVRPESSHAIRAFVAIPLPAALRAKLSVLQRDLQSNLPAGAVRWTRADQIHLTLKFMGNVAPESLPDLEGALQRACQAAPSFQVRAEGVGCFPDAKQPRIVWVGIAGAGDALQALQASIERETKQWGEPDSRAFQPHLTIGRMKHATRDVASALAQALAAKAKAALGEWRAEEVELIRSQLSSEGPQYTRLSLQVLARGC